MRRSARNLLCLTLYTLRVPAHVISRILRLTARPRCSIKSP